MRGYVLGNRKLVREKTFARERKTDFWDKREKNQEQRGISQEERISVAIVLLN